MADEMLKTVTRLAITLEGKVKGKLQGQVLRHISGDLSTSINHEVTQSPDSILGRVFSNGTVKYAAIHEYGYQGPETVSEHMRHVVFGRDVAPFVVPSFVREMNMPARSFLRSTLTENAAMIERELTDAVARAYGAS